MAKPKPLPTAEYLRQCLSYDPMTGLLTWLIRPFSHFPISRDANAWNGQFAGKTAGSLRPRGWLTVTIHYRVCKAHRVIWKIVTGNDPVALIDHKDCNPANNRWDNLREATTSQNNHNQGKHIRNKSGFKGVSLDPSRNKWVAQICFMGKDRTLGRYNTAEEAYAAYCAAAAELHGEFSRTV